MNATSAMSESMIHVPRSKVASPTKAARFNALCIVALALVTAVVRAQTNLTELPNTSGNASTETALLASRIFGIESLTNTVERARAVLAFFPEDSADLKKWLVQVPMNQDQEAWLKAHPLLSNNIQQQVNFVLDLQKAQLKALQAAPGTLTAQQAVQSPNVWEKVKDLPEPELEKVLPTLVPDSVLPSLLEQRNTAETALAQKRSIFFSDANPELVAQKVELSAINLQISNRISGIMEALKIQYVTTKPSETSIEESEEDQEIARIQDMTQNSPDLINATSNDRRSPLVDAAARGRLKVAAFLLDHGAEVDVGGKDGPPLAAAAKAGQRTMIEFLLEHGADVNVDNGAALQAAIEHGYEAVAETLLKAHADVNVENNIGQTPLTVAAMGGKTKFIQMLLDAGANPNLADDGGVTPLSSATLVNFPSDLAPLKLLLNAKADSDGGRYNAPLLCAINNRNTKSAELLLQAGANPNLKGLIDNLRNLSRDGYNHTTPLWSAIYMGDTTMVQLLLKYRADPNDSQIGNTPMIFSALSNNSILRALLRAGANPNVENEKGRTPLSFAVLSGSVETVEALLAAKADPNGGACDPPLLCAINDDDTKSAELLLQAGANPNLKSAIRGSFRNFNTDGSYTPLQAAVSIYQLSMVQLLLNYKADPNDSQIDKTPVIFWALSDTSILQALLDGGANPNVRNGDGHTPLRIAEDVESGDASFGNNISPDQQKAIAALTADLLRQHGALEALPNWDSITISRPSTRFSATIFERGTNDWNQFTLYDLLGVQYTLLSASIRPNWNQDSWTYNLNPVNNSLAFPDFSRIVVRRPPISGTNWTVLSIDLAGALDSGDRSADVPLKFGDVVEIPESDHVLNAPWTGLTTNQLLTLAHCLTRHLQISVNGMTTNFTVGPQVEVGGAWHSQFNSYEVPGLVKLTLQGFMLWPALDNSQLLLSSSDLSHVLVRRHDPATGQIHEWTVDCSNPGTAPDFWLRDGDEIDVPEQR